jgi:alpha-tubulin suppressor-like RCC1 family protein
VLNRVTKIAAGHDFALALRSDGIVFAWGHGQLGQLGNGTTADSPVPVKIAGLSRVTGIPAYVAGASAGAGFAAVLGTDGSVWDWGANGLGQLGVAPESSIVTRPVNAFAAGSGITQLSAGHAHMLALESDGTVLAWGFNQSGQLGHGPFGQTSAGPAPVTGLAGATQVSAGWQSSYAVHTVPFLLGS